MSKLVYGVGVNNVVGSSPNSSPRPVYLTWSRMLERCYSPKCQERKPTYIGCKVCEEWKLFSNFKAWMDKQDWEGMQLDKDILGDGKLYSPETCCFVEPWLNNLLANKKRSNSGLPIGVSKSGSGFKAAIRVNGRRSHLGQFQTASQAEEAYVAARNSRLQNVMADYPNKKVRKAILQRVV